MSTHTNPTYSDPTPRSRPTDKLGTRFHAWLLASRPKTLPAAAVPVLVGSALAYKVGEFNALAAFAALLSALLIQIGTNFANDLYDYKKGADTAARLGPIRVTSAGLLSPESVRNGMFAAFGLAAVFGLYLIWLGGWPILLIGVASILAGIAYTAGPLPLGYNGLGDLFVFLFFGVIAVVGTFYVHTLEVTPVALAVSVPVGALATAILVVNNVRDVETDRVAGKRTLAVLFGRKAARGEYVLLLTAGYLTLLPLALSSVVSVGVLLPLLTLPFAYRLVRIVLTRTDGATLNSALAGTARLMALFGLLFALGLVL